MKWIRRIEKKQQKMYIFLIFSPHKGEKKEISIPKNVIKMRCATYLLHIDALPYVSIPIGKEQLVKNNK